MYERVLTYLNIALIIVCGAAIWYLSTATYTKPRGISLLENDIWGIESPYGGNDSDPGGVPPTLRPPSMNPVILTNKDAMRLLFTPTPTPTPTPPPPPKPPLLKELIYAWRLNSIISDTQIEITDDKSKESFVMNTGESRTTPDKKGQGEHPVKLESVSMSDLCAKFTFLDQEMDVCF
jgi:hypothetical protein